MSEQPTPDLAAQQILAALSACFDQAEVKYKPAVVSGNRAMALFYVDARVIQDRLDDALGVENWQDDYEVLEGGSVVCRLRLRVAGEWITKVDVGSPSEQPDDGDRMKAAFSDALKRAAVKFGVGRYLYRLPQQWADYDPQKRQFVRPPTLPAWAVPGKAAGAPQAPPAAAPAQAPPPVGDEAEARTTIPDIDRRLRAAKPPRTWRSGLSYVGVRLAADWAEPAGAPQALGAVLALLAGGVLTIYQLRQLHRELQPKARQRQPQKQTA